MRCRLRHCHCKQDSDSGSQDVWLRPAPSLGIITVLIAVADLTASHSRAVEQYMPSHKCR